MHVLPTSKFLSMLQYRHSFKVVFIYFVSHKVGLKVRVLFRTFSQIFIIISRSWNVMFSLLAICGVFSVYCAWKKFKTWHAWVLCIFKTWSKLLVHTICLCNGLFWCFCINIVYANEWASALFFYKKALNFKVLKLMLELFWLGWSMISI